ncbi:MAG: WD40 repeat domain-containing protein, partial [Spirulina sp.]
FIDEIDSVLRMEFKDDFFALIRFFYNQKAENPEYKRLAFAFFGVATPSDLIGDKTRTSFNIGKAIALNGFEFEEAIALESGLEGKVKHPRSLLKRILEWTGGQPFLTQKICQLIINACEGLIFLPYDTNQFENESIWLDRLIESCIINDWEMQDEPEHLKTIRERLFANDKSIASLLGLYQKIWQDGGIVADNSPDQTELRLSGLVVKRQRKIKVYNRIYQKVFDRTWIDEELTNLRPYAESIAAWYASDCQDDSRLLTGQALEEALNWANDKRLSDRDREFLRESQNLKTQRDLEAEKTKKEAAQKAEQILREANKKIIRRGIIGVTVTFVLALTGAVGSGLYSQQKLLEVREGTRLERLATRAWQQFEFSEIQALISAIKSGHHLQSLVKDDRPLEKYPAIGPILTLQMILDNIRERNQIEAHPDGVYVVDFSPDGSTFATAGEDGMARIWDLSGQLETELAGHRGAIFSLDFSPDGKTIVTAGEDGTVRFWNLLGQEKREIKVDRYQVSSISLSPDGERMAIVKDNGTVQLWHLSKPQQLIQLQDHSGFVYHLDFSPDGQQIVTAGADGTVRLWNLLGQQLQILNGHEKPVYYVRFNPQGDQLATVGEDGTVRFWDLSGQQLKILANNHPRIFSLSFSPQREHLVTVGEKGTAIVWDLLGEQLKRLIQLKSHEGAVYSVSYSPDGNLLVTGGRDGTARIWELSDKPLTEWEGHLGRIEQIDFSPDGAIVATAGGEGKGRLWNLSGEQLVELDSQNWITSIRFSPKEQLIATSSLEGKIELWDFMGNAIAEFDSLQDGVWRVSFSPNGKQILSVGKDGNAGLWSLSGTQLAQFGSSQSWVASVDFSPDGQPIATAEKDGTIRLWSLSGKQQFQFQSDRSGIRDIKFSPNGQYLATLGEEGVVGLWDLAGKEIISIQGHQEKVTSMNISADGKQIVTAGQDGIVRVWLVSGQQFAQFDTRRSVESVSFSPDGKQIATGGGNGKIVLLSLERLDRLLERGCDWVRDYRLSHPEVLEECSSR